MFGCLFRFHARTNTTTTLLFNTYDRYFLREKSYVQREHNRGRKFGKILGFNVLLLFNVLNKDIMLCLPLFHHTTLYCSD